MQPASVRVAQSRLVKHSKGDRGRALRSIRGAVRGPRSVFRRRVEQPLDSRQSQASQTQRSLMLLRSQDWANLSVSRPSPSLKKSFVSRPASSNLRSRNAKSPTARPQSVTAHHKVLTRVRR